MKMKQKKKSTKSVSDKIADALTVKARPDIEDDHVFGTKPKTVSREDFSWSESENEAAISDFRKRNVNLLSDISKKYEGEVVSRKELVSNSDGETDDDSDSDDAAADIVAKLKALNRKKSVTEDSEYSSEDEESNIKEKDSSESSDEGESDDYSIMQQKSKEDSDEDDEEEGEEEEDGDEEGYDISQMDEPPKEEVFEHVKKQNISEEAKKGASVRNQLLIWESLLEMRIHLQRCLNTANQMPMKDTYNDLKHDNTFSEESNKAKLNLTNVLDKMLSLQSILLNKYPETKTLSLDKSQDSKKSEEKAESDEEIPSDTDNEEIPSDTEEEDNAQPEKIETKSNKTPNNIKKRKLEDYEKEISTSHKVFKNFRDSTIQKWNEKTRLATAANIKSTPTNTILQQISYILSDKEKLLKRTQLKRSDFDIIGYQKPITEEQDESLTLKSRKDGDEYIPEIFDDSDFYHQLLRELIECKSADISDPVQLSRQWIALQQMRSKMKRKVDTKATKGRKIKYVVHNQLVNFMAPEKCTTWTEESSTELYNSLFGKMFEVNSIGVTNVDNGFKIM